MGTKTVHGLAGLKKQLVADMKAREKRVQRATQLAAKAGEQTIKANVPVAFGDLRNSVEAIGPQIIIDAPHAQPVNNGSRPHFPPVAPIIAWARLRGFADPEGAGWAIAKKIAERGTPPVFFVENSLPALHAQLDAFVKAALPD